MKHYDYDDSVCVNKMENKIIDNELLRIQKLAFHPHKIHTI